MSRHGIYIFRGHLGRSRLSFVHNVCLTLIFHFITNKFVLEYLFHHTVVVITQKIIECKTSGLYRDFKSYRDKRARRARLSMAAAITLGIRAVQGRTYSGLFGSPLPRPAPPHFLILIPRHLICFPVSSNPCSFFKPEIFYYSLTSQTSLDSQTILTSNGIYIVIVLHCHFIIVKLKRVQREQDCYGTVADSNVARAHDICRTCFECYH